MRGTGPLKLCLLGIHKALEGCRYHKIDRRDSRPSSQQISPVLGKAAHWGCLGRGTLHCGKVSIEERDRRSGGPLPGWREIFCHMSYRAFSEDLLKLS